MYGGYQLQLILESFNCMGTFLQDANMVGAMNLIQGSNSSAVAVENTGNVTAQAVQNELKAMDDIQRALLPTLMCAAASQGFTNDLSDMIFRCDHHFCSASSIDRLIEIFLLFLLVQTHDFQ